MYALVKDGCVVKYPYTATDLRFDNPQTSFPYGMLADELLADWGVLPVKDAPMPAHDNATHKAVELLPALVNGVWTRRWEIVALTSDEVFSAKKQRSQSVRDERDAKLAACDWTQLSDAQTNKDAWAAYRQALRDVPAQAGFPFNVSWPLEPAA